LVVAARHDEQWALDSSSQAARAVGTETKRRPGGGDLWPPVRAIEGKQSAVAIEGVGRREHGHRASRPGQRDEARRPTNQRPERVEYGDAGEPQERTYRLMTRRVARRRSPVSHRRLRDDGRQFRMPSGHSQDLSPRQRERPRRDFAAIDARQSAGECQRGVPVSQLVIDANDLPGLASALAEPAVVEGQDREAGGVEGSGETVGGWLLRYGEPTRHHDDRSVVASVEPSGTRVVPTLEPDLLALNTHGRRG